MQMVVDMFAYAVSSILEARSNADETIFDISKKRLNWPFCLIQTNLQLL